jgi:hypothetical protein
MAEQQTVRTTYEEEYQARIDKWRIRLKELAEAPRADEFAAVKTAIEADLALAELKIKARQGDWAKIVVWVSLLSPAVAVILGAILGAWLKGRC